MNQHTEDLAKELFKKVYPRERWEELYPSVQKGFKRLSFLFEEKMLDAKIDEVLRIGELIAKNYRNNRIAELKQQKLRLKCK